jgi:aspartate-semialdehyde dehydrogenase
MKVAVVGATGLVGQVMLKVLEERKFPVTTIYPVASEKSVGKEVDFLNKKHKVIGIPESIDKHPALAIFSAGGQTSLQWAPEYSKAGTTVVDNSSAWRMDKTKKLIVPEINGQILTAEDKIIANPNCSTIQMVLALAPLHKKYRIKRVVVSTYQSVTGTGIKAVRQLENERAGIQDEMAYPHRIDKNCLPHCDVFLDNGYTKEEMKMVNETRKIFNDDSIMVTATAVRVPVVGGHSEAVNIEFENDYSLDDVRNLLSETPGIIVQDDPSKNIYPMPCDAEGKDEVFVGRIRRDESREKCLNMWIVSDNLRKGAATNAIQIAEYLVGKGLL